MLSLFSASSKTLRGKLAQLGFTMIELLIVIAILGILAVAVLSAINPIEQINRGRDTGSRSDAEQLLNGIDRYNAFQGYYPWQVNAQDAAVAVPWRQVDETWLDSGATCPVYEKLSQATTGGCTGSDELKVSYFERVNTSDAATALFIYNRGQVGDSTYVCFVPRSKAFLTEAKTRCVDNSGQGLPDDLDAPEVCADFGTATDDVFICLP